VPPPAAAALHLHWRVPVMVCRSAITKAASAISGDNRSATVCTLLRFGGAASITTAMRAFVLCVGAFQSSRRLAGRSWYIDLTSVCID
jgi:hypothetical protein